MARRGDDGGRDYGGGAAAGAVAMVQESKGERPRGEWEEREGDVGVGMALLDASRASAEAGGGRRVAAGAGHALRVLLVGGGRRPASQSAGPSQVAGPAQVRPRWASLSLFFICFTFSI